MRTRRLAVRPPEALLCVSADRSMGAVLGQLQEEEEEVIREEKPSPIEVSSVTRPVHGLPPSTMPTMLRLPTCLFARRLPRQ